MGKKLRVAVVFGGRSEEHEISLLSARSVISQLDRAKYDLALYGIDRQGKWHRLDTPAVLERLDQPLQIAGSTAVVAPPSYPTVTQTEMTRIGNDPIDVVFPVVHGRLCEDGAIQGLLELAGVPYVGAGVLGSAIGMDKEVAKRLVGEAGLPVVPYISLRSGRWEKKLAEIERRVSDELGYPVFVKPVNQGSSVGVHKVKEAAGLEAAIRDAFRFDQKVLIEKGIDAREIELAVIEGRGGGTPEVSIPGEIRPRAEFYSYEAKYLDDNGAELLIPAELDEAQVREAQKLGAAIFEALECDGMGRVDLFLDRKTGKFYFNEINTIPGFTQISMFPKLWEASGLPYSRLLDRLIELAMERYERRGQVGTAKR